MITDYIEVPDNKWGIVVVRDFDVFDEKVELLAIMRSFGMSLYNAKRALDILSNHNTGMAISLADLKMSAIFISKATSTSEWWSTCLHEIRHAAQAIIEYYGADWGEDDAYLTGFLTKELVGIVGEPCIQAF